MGKYKKGILGAFSGKITFLLLNKSFNLNCHKFYFTTTINGFQSPGSMIGGIS